MNPCRLLGDVGPVERMEATAVVRNHNASVSRTGEEAILRAPGFFHYAIQLPPRGRKGDLIKTMSEPIHFTDTVIPLSRRLILGNIRIAEPAVGVSSANCHTNSDPNVQTSEKHLLTMLTTLHQAAHLTPPRRASARHPAVIHAPGLRSPSMQSDAPWQPAHAVMGLTPRRICPLPQSSLGRPGLHRSRRVFLACCQVLRLIRGAHRPEVSHGRCPSRPIPPP